MEHKISDVIQGKEKKLIKIKEKDKGKRRFTFGKRIMVFFCPNLTDSSNIKKKNLWKDKEEMDFTKEILKLMKIKVSRQTAYREDKEKEDKNKKKTKK